MSSIQEIIEVAQQWGRLGFYVAPGIEVRGKMGHVKGAASVTGGRNVRDLFKAAARDHRVCGVWLHLARPERRLIALDIDVKDGKDGLEWLEEGDLRVEGAWQRSKSEEGRHYVWPYPADWPELGDQDYASTGVELKTSWLKVYSTLEGGPKGAWGWPEVTPAEIDRYQAPDWIPRLSRQKGWSERWRTPKRATCSYTGNIYTLSLPTPSPWSLPQVGSVEPAPRRRCNTTGVYQSLDDPEVVRAGRVTCKSLACPRCGPYKLQRWYEHLGDKLAAAPGLYAAECPEAGWRSLQGRIRRRDGQYVYVPLAGRLYVLTTADVGTPVTVHEAKALLAAALRLVPSHYVERRHMIQPSEGWALDKAEDREPGKWKWVASPALALEQVDELVRAAGATVEQVKGGSTSLSSVTYRFAGLEENWGLRTRWDRLMRRLKELRPLPTWAPPDEDEEDDDWDYTAPYGVRCAG